MAEVGIIWLFVAYFTRSLRARLRLPKFKNAPMKELTAAPAHLPMKAVEVEHAAWMHEMVVEHRTAEHPLVIVPEEPFGDWLQRYALEAWFPAAAETEATPIADQLIEPDAIDLEWLAFNTGAWRQIGADDLVGASA